MGFNLSLEKRCRFSYSYVSSIGSNDSYSRSIERLMQFNVTFTHPTTTVDNSMDYGIFHFADTQQVFALLRKFQPKKKNENYSTATIA